MGMSSVSFRRWRWLPAVGVAASVLVTVGLPATVAGALPPYYPTPVTAHLQNGWQDVTGFGKAAVAVDGNGIAHLSGVIDGGSDASLAFVLPSGDEPASYIYINIQDSTVGDDAYLEITTSGDVYVYGPNVNAAAWLYGASFRVASSPLAFSDVTLENGWVSENSTFDSGDPAVAVDSEGIVHLSGSMADGTSTTVAFVLPAADRPPADIYLNTYTDGGTTGYLEIEKNGDVVPVGSDVASYTSLAGITFRSAESILSANKLKLQNGWTGGAYTTGVPTVTRDQYGFVHLAGGLTNSSDGNPVTVLPKADRPTHQLCETNYNFDGSIGATCIYSNGDVALLGTGSSAPYTDDEFSSFSPITFEAGI
jgi:hypothetical protein